MPFLLVPSVGFVLAPNDIVTSKIMYEMLIHAEYVKQCRVMYRRYDSYDFNERSTTVRSGNSI